jgi:hypothetical protein
MLNHHRVSSSRDLTREKLRTAFSSVDLNMLSKSLSLLPF